MDIEVKEEVLSRLKEIRSFHNASLDQYAMRCPLCGDSKKDPSKTRFYIKLNTHDESPILYHCFNCESSGVLTPDILRSMSISDLGLNSRLLSFNKESKKAIIRRLGIKNEKLRIKVPEVKCTKRNMLKKKYIEDRIGVELTFKELLQLKCIFSLKDFGEVNSIDKFTVSADRAQRLNDDYVGFLTMNNEYINFRDITNSNKLRYDKYTIVPGLIDTVKMYSIPNAVDVLTTESIVINIAEGVFDVLGIYYNIQNRNIANNIYTAVCGSGYMNVVRHYIRMGFIGDNITINIFSDSDKEPYFYKHVISYAKQWVGHVNLIYNMKSKDYGVPKDDILLNIKKV